MKAWSRALLFAPLALALGAGACELIAGIEDLIDTRDGGVTTGSGGSGGGASSVCRLASLDGCDGGPCAPETFMSGLVSPIGVAAHAGRVYWSESGRVAGKRADAGGPADMIWPLSNPLFSGQPEEIAADETGVYWAYYNGPCVGHGPHDAGPLSLLGDCQGTYGGKLLLHGDHVFVVVSPQEFAGDCDGGAGCCGPAGKGCVFKVPKAGGPVSYYAQSEDTSDALAVTDHDVYWSSFSGGSGVIKRCPIEGCPAGSGPEVVVEDAGNVGDLAIDEGALYWIESAGGNVLRKELGQPAATAPYVLAPNVYFGSALAVDDTFVYFSDDHRIFRTPKVPAAASTVDPVTGATTWPWVPDLVLTCDHVYFVDRAAEGSVLRAPR